MRTVAVLLTLLAATPASAGAVEEAAGQVIGNPMIGLSVLGALALLAGGLRFVRRRRGADPAADALSQAEFQARAEARIRMALRTPARA
jgi:hypothetical protein